MRSPAYDVLFHTRSYEKYMYVLYYYIYTYLYIYICRGKWKITQPNDFNRQIGEYIKQNILMRMTRDRAARPHRQRRAYIAKSRALHHHSSGQPRKLR